MDPLALLPSGLSVLPLIRGMAILVAAHVIGRYLRGPLGRLLDGRVDTTLRTFVLSSVHPLLLVIAVPPALEQLGVSVTSIIAVLSTVGLTIGFALKDSLSNVASGALLLTTRPFGVGDTVTVAGVTGTVRRVRILTTELDTDDGRRVNVTNDKVLASPMEQHAVDGQTRIEVVLRVPRHHVDGALMRRLTEACRTAVPDALGHTVVPLDYDGDHARLAVRASLVATRAGSARIDLFVALAAALPSTDGHLA